MAETLATEQSRLVEQVASNVASVAANAASKEELKEHKTVLKEYKSDLKEDFKRLEASFDTKLDAKIEKSKFDLVKWLIGSLIAQSGVLFTVLRFFPKAG